MLQASNISFGYRRSGREVDNVAVRLDVGRTIVLGPNGAGKSTLVQILAGALRHSGTVTLDGIQESGRSKSRSYRRAVGWLPQDVVPFRGLSAHEHVAYCAWLKGLPMPRARENAAAALARVGLSDSRDTRGDRLSGGQRRRLGIASAIAHEARYLLLDEPTAGLDPEERDRLIALIDTLGSDHALGIVTHDVDGLVNEGSRIVVMRAGRVSFEGTTEDFVDPATAGAPLPERVRHAYRAQVG